MSVTESTVPVFHGSGPSCSRAHQPLRDCSFSCSGLFDTTGRVEHLQCFSELINMLIFIINHALRKYVKNVSSAQRAIFKHYWNLS
ncbi:mCG123423, isoform CRA_a [Mus musculus]|nr:mCG123423, isoform CRA_a [Mus musculus]